MNDSGPVSEATTHAERLGVRVPPWARYLLGFVGLVVFGLILVTGNAGSVGSLPNDLEGSEGCTVDAVAEKPERHSKNSESWRVLITCPELGTRDVLVTEVNADRLTDVDRVASELERVRENGLTIDIIGSVGADWGAISRPRITSFSVNEFPRT